ncbi:MAG: hypothetical protein P9L92_05365 [Candidatus Electryonea clarkiae]|nr:hypothetical protein [Candidatus Electryonea clarkiae]
MRGSSMMPALRDGDKAKIQPVSRESVLSFPPGTLILFISTKLNEPVIHRLVGTGKHVVFEKGDQSKIIRAVKPESVVGMVTHLKRNGKERQVSLPFAWKLRKLLTISWLKS